jgi:DNA polymerase
VDAAVKTAIRSRRKVDLFGISVTYRSGMLFIRLPSGRSLSYVKPRLGLNRFGGESVTYMGLNPAHKWDWIESYGPKFVENIVQGISRDILAEAMLRISKHDDRRIVAHVHDEVIVEAEPEDSVQEICDRMAVVPFWADGLLLRADGYECDFYRKD